jgi:hypothetical protein
LVGKGSQQQPAGSAAAGSAAVAISGRFVPCAAWVSARRAWASRARQDLRLEYRSTSMESMTLSRRRRLEDLLIPADSKD